MTAADNASLVAFFSQLAVKRWLVPGLHVRPLVAELFLTENCNLRCKSCNCWLENTKGELTTDEWKNVLRQLIALKIHGVTGEYIRQIRAAGLQPTPDELMAFRIHHVTADYINELKQTGLRNLKAQDLVALRIHGAETAWIRQIQALGYANLSVDNIVALRIHGVTPEFIRDAQSHGLKDLSLDKLIQLKQLGILKTSAITFI